MKALACLGVQTDVLCECGPTNVPANTELMELDGKSIWGETDLGCGPVCLESPRDQRHTETRDTETHRHTETDADRDT